MCCLKLGRDVELIGQRDEAEKRIKVATADSRHTVVEVEVEGGGGRSPLGLALQPCAASMQVMYDVVVHIRAFIRRQKNVSH